MTNSERALFAAGAVGCAACAGYALKTGRAMGRYSMVGRTDNPAGYWTLVVIYVVCGVLFLTVCALP